MEIKDNFLKQEEFDKIQEIMVGGVWSNGIGWYYNNAIDYKEQKDKFQFCHSFYESWNPHSQYFNILKPILDIINPLSIYRIKANLLTKTPNIVENTFHVDIYLPEEKLKQWTTSIFYMNTNNGYTKFENGTKIESVANRMITFPANMKHTGTSCSDEKTRIVINFNFFQ